MISSSELSGVTLDSLIEREWLAVNKVGGYACSTLAGLNSRKYHGLLVAAMSPPIRRMVLLAKMEEVVSCDGQALALSCNEYPGVIHPQGHQALATFAPTPFPRWEYRGNGWAILKELRLLRGENTVVLTYTLVSEKTVELQVRPLLALRGIHELSYQWNASLEAEKWFGQPAQQRGGRGRTLRNPKEKCKDWRVPATNRTPEVFFSHDGEFAGQGVWYLNTIYRREEERGYSALEDLWNPGLIRWKLTPGQTIHFACSSDPIDLEKAVEKADRQYAPNEGPRGVEGGAAPAVHNEDAKNLDALMRAADAFVLELKQEKGQDDVAVMSNYTWSGPASRSGLAGFTGLFLVTGKFVHGRRYIDSLIGQMRNGLIPSEYSESNATPLYQASDVSLWLCNAVGEYLRYTNDEATVRRWFEPMVAIVDHYRRGTDLGIAMDDDGFIRSADARFGTTWMDAKVGDWVMTPRRGRAVEVNALWYNALRLTASLAGRFGNDSWAKEVSNIADRVYASFNEKFWNEPEGICHDVIGDEEVDESLRPNQLLSASLPYSVLDPARHAGMLEKVKWELLTPFGLRTRGPSDPAYHGTCSGDFVERDRAMHQGCVHPWLLGPFVAVHLKVNGRSAQARRDVKELLDGCIGYIQGEGEGYLCEMFNGDVPHRPGGAIASAIGTAEILRAYVEDVLDQQPQMATQGRASVTVSKPTKWPISH